MRLIAGIATLLLTGAPLIAAADEAASSWVMVPGLTTSAIYFNAAVSPEISDHIGNYDVVVIGTDALPWPDGRSVLITTLEVRGRDSPESRWLFRCVNSKDASFSDTGDVCYQLKRP